MRRMRVPHVLGTAHPSSRYWIWDSEINAMPNAICCERWEQRDLNPPQRISSETAHQMGSFQDCNGSALQLVINLQQTHSSSFPCNWSPRYYQAILYSRVLTLKPQFFACRRARFRRRNFFLRHFHRWLPVFFQAREPRFMVNEPPTSPPYMRASG